MRHSSVLFVFVFVFFALSSSCDKLSKSDTASRKSTAPALLAKKKQDAPPSTTDIQSANPLPTTNLPPSPRVTDAAAPSTYGLVSSPKGIDAAAAPTTYATAAAVAAPIVGNWLNVEDPDETVVFTDHSYETYYEGQKVVEEEMVYHPVCPSDCSGGQSVGVPCFTISSQYGKDCFGILRVTEDELELTMLGVSTASILYKRIKP